MRFLRALIYYFVLLLAAIPVGISCVLCWPFVDINRRYDWFVRTWMRFALLAGKWICGLDYEVRGAENLPDSSTRAVIFCKHQSAWETLFIPAWMPERVGYVYKESIHWIPFFGWAVKSMQMIPIDRSNGRKSFEQILRGGSVMLNRGWWVGIFPEGTRVAPGATSTYKSGAARFAAREKAVIVPIAVNSGEFWPRNSFGKIPGKIVVSIGPAVPTEGKTFAEANHIASEWIEAEVRRIGNPKFYKEKQQ